MSTTAPKATRKKLSIAEKYALTLKAKKIPFPIPDEEMDRILDEIYDARQRGDEAEADRLRDQIPINWQAAVVVIEQFGVERLLEMNFDLRYAVAVLGEDFVYGRG